MYDITADTRDNRLYIDLSGCLDKEESREAADVVLTRAQRLRDGFDVVTDVTGCTPQSPEAVEPMRSIRNQLQVLGVDRVVRVTDDSTDRFGVDVFNAETQDVEYSLQRATSMREAEQKLDIDDGYGH